MTFQFPTAANFGRACLLTAASLLLLAAGDPAAPLAAAAAAPETPNTLTIPASLVAPMASVPADDGVTAAPEAQPKPARLSAMVDALQADLDSGDADVRCLATAVYFEARGEPLEGQLAVAQSILNRVASGRYASSACGVINQPGQYSFAHARLPSAGQDWRTALTIAAIARSGQFRQVAPRAISFHATRVNVAWNMTRVAQIGNHVFYR